MAIKKIVDVFASKTDARRILREIQILRHLDHPNTVNVLEILVSIYSCIQAPTNQNHLHTSTHIHPFHKVPPDFSTFRNLYVVFEAMNMDMRRLIKVSVGCGVGLACCLNSG